MIVNSEKLKRMRHQKNWTQQQLADQCNLSLRTIQRVEKDGVASSDTVSAYCAVFEVCHSDIIIEKEQLMQNNASQQNTVPYAWFISGILFGSLTTTVLISLIRQL